MKKADLTPGMEVENKFGVTFIVIETHGWAKNTGWENHTVTTRWNDRDVEVFGRYGGTRSPCALLVRKEMVEKLNGSLNGHMLRPQDLHPVGTYAAMRKQEEDQIDAEVEADRALLARVRELWGDKTDVLLKGADIEIEEDALLTSRERTTLNVMVLCGEQR